MPQLRMLLLGTANISDDGLSNMRYLKYLVELDISNNSPTYRYRNKITDDGLFHLQNNVSIQNLRIGFNINTSDVGIKYICFLKNLIYLDLYLTDITDLSLLYISQSLSNFETLNIESCEDITNIGIRHISSLPVLKFLIINYCNDVTKEGLDCLQSHVHVSYAKEEDELSLEEGDDDDEESEDVSDDDSYYSSDSIQELSDAQ